MTAKREPPFRVGDLVTGKNVRRRDPCSRRRDVGDPQVRTEPVLADSRPDDYSPLELRVAKNDTIGRGRRMPLELRGGADREDSSVSSLERNRASTHGSGPSFAQSQANCMRRFFFISLALAIAVLGVHLTALGQFGRGAQAVARAVTGSESERAAARQEANHSFQRGVVFRYAGAGFALASVGFLLALARRQEPAPRPLVCVLLGVYVVLQFVWV